MDIYVGIHMHVYVCIWIYRVIASVFHVEKRFHVKKVKFLQGFYSSNFYFILVTPIMLFLSELPPAAVLYQLLYN